MSSLEKTRQAAREYIRRGWCPLPIEHKRKEPWEIKKLYGVNWRDLRITEQEVDKYFYGKFTNIGILAGECSNLFILDLDVNPWKSKGKYITPAPNVPNREELWEFEQKYGSTIWNPDDPDSCKGSSYHWWNALIEKHGKPDTTVVRTGSGGQQWYFLHPENSGLNNRSGRVHPAVDWRTDGGQVVAPPSIHPTGNPYTFISEAPLNPVPEWLLYEIQNGDWEAELKRSSVTVDLANLDLDTFPEDVDSDTPPEEKQPESEGTWKVETTEVQRLRDTQHYPHGTRFKSIQKIAGHFAALGYFGEELVDVMRPYNARCEYVKEDDFDEKRLRGICAGVEKAEKEKRAREAKDGTAQGYKFPLTDLGNAERFAATYSDKFRYDYTSDTLYFWDGRRWNSDIAQGKVIQFAGENARAIRKAGDKEPDPKRKEALVKHGYRSESKNSLRNCFDLAKNLEPIATAGREFDRDLHLFNVENGTIDLKTGELLPHDPERLITQIAPVTFDPAATCPLWEKALDTYCCGDTELVLYLQRFFGYCLTGSIRERSFTFWNGDGANGKSTVLDTMLLIMGDYAIVIPKEFIALKKDSMEKQRTTVLLKKKRLACINETLKKDTLDTAIVKEQTGQAVISGRALYKEAETFCPSHKFVVSTQHLPRVEENSSGVWDRMVVIDFKHRIAAEDRVKDYHLRFVPEYSGILNWLIRGAVDYYRDGLTIPEHIQYANSRYRDDSNPLAEFLAEYCDVESPTVELRKQKKTWAYRVRASDLYRTYKYSTDKPMSQKNFGVELRDQGFVKVRLADGYFYQGIRLKAQEVEEEEEENTWGVAV